MFRKVQDFESTSGVGNNVQGNRTYLRASSSLGIHSSKTGTSKQKTKWKVLFFLYNIGRAGQRDIR